MFCDWLISGTCLMLVWVVHVCLHPISKFKETRRASVDWRRKKKKGGGGGEIPTRMKQHRKGVNNGQISDTYSKGHNHRGLTLAMTLPWCAREAVNTLITGSPSLHSTLWAFSWKRTLTKEHQPPTLLLKPLFHWVWDGISLWVSLPIYSDEMIWGSFCAGHGGIIDGLCVQMSAHWSQCIYNTFTCEKAGEGGVRPWWKCTCKRDPCGVDDGVCYCCVSFLFVCFGCFLLLVGFFFLLVLFVCWGVRVGGSSLHTHCKWLNPSTKTVHLSRLLSVTSLLQHSTWLPTARIFWL